MDKKNLIEELSNNRNEAELKYEEHNANGEVLLFKHEYGKYWAYSQSIKLAEQLDETKTEPCDICKHYKPPFNVIYQIDDINAKKYNEIVVNFCPNCGRKLK